MAYRIRYSEGMQQRMRKVMAASSRAAKCFRENVLSLLEDRGMTITHLAEETGMGRAGLSRVLHGHEAVTLDRAERIAKHLQVELTDLISRQKNIPQIA